MASSSQQQPVIETIGVIGVGAIAEAIVDGLSAGPNPPVISLSPRSAGRSSALAARYPNVVVCADNQSVADACDVLLLTVGPGDVAGVLDDLTIANGRVLISAVAGVSIDEVRAQVGHGVAVVRSIPLPAVRERQGLTALFPEHPIAQALFTQLGDTIQAPNEETFGALSTATATVSAYLQYLSVVARWLAHQGMGIEAADLFVRSTFEGLGSALRDVDEPLRTLSRGHETPHGLNEQVRTTWFDAANQAALTATLDQVLHRVRTSASAE